VKWQITCKVERTYEFEVEAPRKNEAEVKAEQVLFNYYGMACGMCDDVRWALKPEEPPPVLTAELTMRGKKYPVVYKDVNDQPEMPLFFPLDQDQAPDRPGWWINTLGHVILKLDMAPPEELQDLFVREVARRNWVQEGHEELSFRSAMAKLRGNAPIYVDPTRQRIAPRYQRFVRDADYSLAYAGKNLIYVECYAAAEGLYAVVMGGSTDWAFPR